MLLMQNEAISRRTLNIFFLIDISKNMSGAKIGTINFAIEELIPELQQVKKKILKEKSKFMF